MICVSIQETDLQKCKQILKNANMAEIRADLCKFPLCDIEQIISGHPNILITCRIANSSREFAYEQITKAIIKGARYVDIELEAPDTHLEYTKSYAKANGCKLIISYHNFEGTNSLEELTGIYNLCLRKGADIVKIVTTAHTISDAVRTLSLYKTQEYLAQKKGTLVAFAMGEAGKFTRHLCLTMGSPFTYAAYSQEDATAPGQYTRDEMEQLLNPGWQSNGEQISPAQLPPSLTIPCSKSVAQRAILAAALSPGESRLENYAPCNDITGALEVIKQLGSTVQISENKLYITGNYPHTSLSPAPHPHKTHPHTPHPAHLNVGESGLLTRLLIPLVAHLSELTHLSGHGSILKRNLGESAKALEAAGVSCKTNNGHLPFEISGKISNCTIQFSGKESSQIVSGFLMTLPLLPHSSTLTITEPTSIPYIRLTLKTLEQFGIKIDTDDSYPDKIMYHIPGNQRYTPANIYMDADWSSAAYFAVAGAIGGCITLLNMPLYSEQADEAILEILKLCGAEIITKAAATKNNLWDITIRKEAGSNTTGRLNAFTYDATNCPDLFPVLATLATNCNGTSCIKGVNRLFQKESNRAESIFSEFTKLGAEINIIDDSMYINGGKLHGARVRSHNDHRIAMSILIAALFIDEPVILDDLKCIDKSFPSFTERLTGKII